MSEKENPQVNRPAVQIFNPRDLGSSLREVAVDVLRREDVELESHWYHSQKDADLFIWKDKDQEIVKQQVTYYGQMIEWSAFEGLRTGLIIEEEGKRGVRGSALIRYDAQVQRQALEQGAQILEFVPGLSEKDRAVLIRNFMGSTFRGASVRFGGQPKPLSWWKSFLKALGLSRKRQ